jgi:hypothetical protein
VQWCLGGRRVRQESPVEVQHAQKSTKLTGGLGRGAVLEWYKPVENPTGSFLICYTRILVFSEMKIETCLYLHVKSPSNLYDLNEN